MRALGMTQVPGRGLSSCQQQSKQAVQVLTTASIISRRPNTIQPIRATSSAFLTLK